MYHRQPHHRAGSDVHVHRVAATHGHYAQIRELPQRFGIHDVHFGDKHVKTGQGLHQLLAGQQAHRLAIARVFDLTHLLQSFHGCIIHIGRDQDPGTEL